MDQARYAWNMTRAGVLLLLLALLFPFFLYIVAHLTGCAGVGGACGAVGALAGIYVKLPLTFLILLVIGWSAFRRIHGLRLGAEWFLLAALLLLTAFQPLAAFGNFWGANFAVGMIFTSFMPLLCLVPLLIFLGVYPDDSPVVQPGARGALLLAAAVGIHAALLMMLLNPLLYFLGLSGVSIAIFQLASLWGVLSPAWVLPLELLVFVAALVTAAARQRA